MDENTLARYQFKRALEEIAAARGRGTELITVYVPPERMISDVTAYLRNEHSQSSNIKSKSTMKNVQGAIESILSRLRGFNRPPPHGLAIFVGHKSIGGDKTRMVAFVLEPPEAVPTFYYRCDSTFFLEPLKDMLTEKQVYGLVVIDRGEATLGYLRGSRIDPIRNIPSLVPRKHGRGGQSQRRFERLIEESAHNFFKKVGEIMTEVYLNEPLLKGILIGGPGATKNEFMDGGFIHHELVKRIVDAFDVGYTNEQGLKELVEAARSRLTQLALNDERDLMNRFTKEIAKHSQSMGTYGEGHVRKALELGAAQIILCSEGLRKDRVHLTCSGCQVVSDLTIDHEADELRCPRCKKVQDVPAERVDLVDDLRALADTTGASVELISGESEEGSMLLRAFGGVGAILRYSPQGLL